jgi:hypothetical protein
MPAAMHWSRMPANALAVSAMIGVRRPGELGHAADQTWPQL